MAEPGRPTEYHEELTPRLAEVLAKKGLTDEEMAGELGIHPSTLYAWKRQYLAFSEALQSGKESVDDRVENALLKRALGYDLKLKKEVVVAGDLQEATYDVHIAPEPGAALSWLKNRRQEKWREKQDIIIEGGGLNIIMSKESDNPDYMSNVELHLPTKTPE